jgi:hypothetical protein
MEKAILEYYRAATQVSYEQGRKCDCYHKREFDRVKDAWVYVGPGCIGAFHSKPSVYHNNQEHKHTCDPDAALSQSSKIRDAIAQQLFPRKPKWKGKLATRPVSSQLREDDKAACQSAMRDRKSFI